MQDAQVVERIRRLYQALRPEMDERMRRQWAAAEARELGRGGVTAVAAATGLSRTTVTAGMGELDLPPERRAAEAGRVRRPGGGRRPLTETDPGLLAALEALVEPATRGDPQSPLRWTCKSTRRLAGELTRRGHPVGERTVASLLREAGYSLQANRKAREGCSHPQMTLTPRAVNLPEPARSQRRPRRRSRMNLTFLGTRGEIEVRSRRHWMHTSLMVAHRRSRVMVDCGLDWLGVAGRLKPRPQAIVLTHAHPDHAWGLRNGAPCPVYATTETWRGLEGFAISERRVLRHRRPCEIAGIVFEAFAVEHSLRAPAVGYRIAAGRSTIFYVPDVVFIRARRAALAGVSLYVGDGATIRRPLVRRRGRRLIGHAPVSAQLTWCREAGVGAAVITHCGSEMVAAEASAAAAVAELGGERGISVTIAYDGMEWRVR